MESGIDDTLCFGPLQEAVNRGLNTLFLNNQLRKAAPPENWKKKTNPPVKCLIKPKEKRLFKCRRLPQVISVALNDSLNYYNLFAITTRGLVLSASPPRLMYLLCSILLPPERSERSPTAPQEKQVIALIDRLICRILHCCSSPASREN